MYFIPPSINLKAEVVDKTDGVKCDDATNRQLYDKLPFIGFYMLYRFLNTVYIL